MDYPTTVQAEQPAILELRAVVWRAATCPDHDRFDDNCPACAIVPQNCPEHTPVLPGQSNPVNWCEACQRLRPDPEDLGAVHEQVVTAEEAIRRHGLPLRSAGWGWIRIPWKEKR